MLLSMICFRHAAEPLSATISEIFTAFWNSPSVTPVSTVTGRVLPQDGGLDTLSGGLGRGGDRLTSRPARVDAAAHN